MAKITPGPIVATASGSVGELTFRQTRQGLVVQQRSNPRQNQTAAQLATQDAFRKAMTTFTDLVPDLKARIRSVTGKLPQTIMQAWVSAYYGMKRNGPWNMTLFDGLVPQLKLLERITTPTTQAFITNLDTPGGDYHAVIQLIIDGSAVGTVSIGPDYPLTVPPTFVSFAPLLPAFTYILFPFDPLAPLSLGKSDAFLGGIP